MYASAVLGRCILCLCINIHIFCIKYLCSIITCLYINDCYVPCVCCICSPLQISESFKSFGMSDESRSVLVVTFEDSTEPVKVCMCVHECVCACACVCVGHRTLDTSATS